MRKFMVGLATASLACGSANAALLLNAYEFNGSGVTVVDSIGGVNGSLFGDASQSGGFLNLNGGGYAELAAAIVPLSGSFSLYLKYADYVATTGIAESVSQGGSGGPGFYVGQYGGNIRLSDQFPGGIGQPFLTGPGTHDILVTTGSGTNVYVDGTLAFTDPTNLVTGAGGSNTRCGSQFYPYGEYVTGKIDAVRLFSGVATYAEASADTGAVPEPASWSLMIAGFGLTGGMVRRTRRRMTALA